MGTLTTIVSDGTFEQTLQRVVDAIREKEFTIFGRINHSIEAKRQELKLRPTELVIFGNPKVGTLLMQDQQTCGIDLPVKILVWEDKAGKVWLSYNSMQQLKTKHHLTGESVAILGKIEDTVGAICEKASGRGG